MERRWRVALWGLLSVAVYVRLSHAAVGLPYLFRWDEPLIVNSGLWALANGWDPFTFRYGSFPIYLSALASAAAFLVEMASGNVTSFAQFVDAGPPLSNVLGFTTNAPLAYWYSRVLFVLISVSGLGFTYAAARQAGATGMGAFLAALMIAVSAVHLRATLLAIGDGIGMTLVAATLAASLWFLQRQTHSRRAIIVAGVTSGLAVATKFSLLWTGVIPMAAVLLGKREWRDQLGKDAGVIALAFAAAFFISAPYALFEPGRFLAGVGDEVAHYSFLGHPGQDGGQPGLRQFVQVGKALSSGFGPRWLSTGILLLGLAGLVATVARQWRAAALLGGWIAFQLVFLAQQVVFFERHLLAMFPALAILAALGAERVAGLVPRRSWLVTAGVCLAFVPAMFTQIVEARQALKPRDTRSFAAEWLVDNVKPGQQVVLSNQLPFDLTELRRARLAVRVIDPLEFPCWFVQDPYTYYVTSHERGPFRDAPVLANFDGRLVTTDEPLFSPQVNIFGRTPGPCDVTPEPASPAWKPLQPEFGGAGYDPSPRYVGHAYSRLGYDGWVKLPTLTVGEGQLTVQVDARATKASSMAPYALVKVKRANNELVGWHFMPLETTRTVKELTFRVSAGDYFVLVSRPDLEPGVSEAYLVELHGVRVRHQ